MWASGGKETHLPFPDFLPCQCPQLSKRDLLFVIMCFMCVSACGCVHVSAGAGGIQKRELTLLELDLQAIASSQRGAGNGTQVPCKQEILVGTGAVTPAPTSVFPIIHLDFVP